MILDFQQKRKVRAVLYHPAMLTIIFVLVVFFLHSTWVVYTKKRASENLKNVLVERVEGLRTRDGELSFKIERLKTEPGIEEEIRSKFSVAKANENMVIVVEEEDIASTTEAKDGSVWRKFLDFFFK